MELLALLKGAGLALPAVLQPGPLQAFLLSRSAQLGRRRALPAALAPLLSDGPILLLVLGVLSQVPPAAMRVLQVVGGAFLLQLATAAARAARRPAPAADAVHAGRSLRDAVVVNLLNPNPYLFWSLVAGPMLVDAWRRSALTAVAFVAGFYGAFVGGLALTVVLFAALSGRGERARAGAGWVSAFALAGFGVWQIVLGVRG